MGLEFYFLEFLCALSLCRVRQFCSTILIIALLAQTFSQGVYYLDYSINKAAYIKNCVNKARPMLHCNGKCQLMKKIEAEEKQNQQQAPVMKLAKTEVFSSHHSDINFAFHYTIINNTVTPFAIGSPIDQPSSCFHPPSFPA